MADANPAREIAAQQVAEPQQPQAHVVVPEAPELALPVPVAQTAPAGGARKTRSLQSLCETFLGLFCQHDNNVIHVENATASLGVERRRIYDVLNVLDGLGVLQKQVKSQYMWLGISTLKLKVEELKLEPDPEPPAEPIDGAGGDRKERSMSLLTTKFVTMLVKAPNGAVELEDAALRLLGRAPGGEKNKSKLRRLYDIANIMTSLGLIEKTHSDNSKTWFRWLGPDSMQAQINSAVEGVQSDAQIQINLNNAAAAAAAAQMNMNMAFAMDPNALATMELPAGFDFSQMAMMPFVFPFVPPGLDPAAAAAAAAAAGIPGLQLPPNPAVAAAPAVDASRKRAREEGSGENEEDADAEAAAKRATAETNNAETNVPITITNVGNSAGAADGMVFNVVNGENGAPMAMWPPMGMWAPAGAPGAMMMPADGTTNAEMIAQQQAMAAAFLQQGGSDAAAMQQMMMAALGAVQMPQQQIVDASVAAPAPAEQKEEQPQQ